MLVHWYFTYGSLERRPYVPEIFKGVFAVLGVVVLVAFALDLYDHRKGGGK